MLDILIKGFNSEGKIVWTDRLYYIGSIQDYITYVKHHNTSVVRVTFDARIKGE